MLLMLSDQLLVLFNGKLGDADIPRSGHSRHEVPVVLVKGLETLRISPAHKLPELSEWLAPQRRDRFDPRRGDRPLARSLWKS